MHRRGGAGSLLLEGISEMAGAAGLETVDIYYWVSEQDGSGSLAEKETNDDTITETKRLSYEEDSFFDCDELSDRESTDYWNTWRESILIDAFLTENGYVILRENQIYSFYERCNRNGKNILEAKDMCVTGIKYKDGIAFAPEPHVAETLNNAFSEDEKYTDTVRLKQAKLKDRKVGANFSYNTFVTSMFCQSAILANYRKGKKVSSDINIADSETKSLVKKIFRELCFLNGINPENLSISTR